MAELLRAVARKRDEQAGAPFDLHPATRSMLQAEVARVVPRRGKEREKTVFVPRFIFAAAAAASIAICAVILFRSEPPAAVHAVLAKNSVSNIVLTSDHFQHGILLASGDGGTSLTLDRGDVLLAPAPSPSVAIRLNHTTLAVMMPLDDEKAKEASDAAALGTLQTYLPPSDAPVPVGLTINTADANNQTVVTNSMNGANFFVNGGNVLHEDETAAPLAPLSPPASSGNFTTGGTVAYFGGIKRDSDFAKDGYAQNDSSGAQRLKDKLDQIILPSVNLRDVTVSEAINTLHKESVAYDTSDTDQAHKGVNIVLYQPGNLAVNSGTRRARDPSSGMGGGAGQGAGATLFGGSAAKQESRAIGGDIPSALAGSHNAAEEPALVPAPALSAAAPVGGAAAPRLETQPAPDAAPKPGSATPSTGTAPPARITLSLKNVALSEALRYVATQGGLEVQVNDSTVNMLPAGDSADMLVTKEYAVPAGFIGGQFADAEKAYHLKAPEVRNLSQSTGNQSQVAKGAERGVPAMPSGTPQLNALDYLKDAGVQFPPGSSADYSPADGRLVVRNTGQNLDLVDKIVDNSIDTELARETVAAKQLAIQHTIRIVDGKEPSAEFVLSSFQVQVEGDVVYIVDADGSIYSGKIEQPLLDKMLASNGRTFTNLATSRQAARDKDALNETQKKLQSQARFPYQNNGMVTAGISNSLTPVVVSATNIAGDNKVAANAEQKVSDVQLQQQQNFYFRATGINRKLRTPVIVEGNYISTTGEQEQTATAAQEQLAERGGGQAGGNGQNSNLKDTPAEEKIKSADKPASVDNNARIEGQAQVGAKSTVEIDAIVVPAKTKTGAGQ